MDGLDDATRTIGIEGYPFIIRFKTISKTPIVSASVEY